MLDVKKVLTKILNAIKTDYIVEEGTTGDWEWRKWNSGRYEAERVHSFGQVTMSTGLITVNSSTGLKILVSATFPTVPSPPHTLTSGQVVIDLIANGINGAQYPFLYRLGDQLRLGTFSTGSSVAVQNVKLLYRVVCGRWK